MENQPSFLRLSELSQQIHDLLYSVYDHYFWVVAEIASLRNSPRGHCYMELVEKEGDRVLAQMRANIWADRYQNINRQFSAVTGTIPGRGMKILFCASLDFHPVYGMSLNITGIEPTYTLGEKARRKMEILDRLTHEGLMEKNKKMPFHLVSQRVAVISSASAAGFGDFTNHLLNNPYSYRFVLKLFKAVMQGENAVTSILKQLFLISKVYKNFDVLVILRGGGAETDLDCFDNYELGKAVACFPIPVICGIGHHRDETVLDYLAHTRVKTPTAAADFLIKKCLDFETGMKNITDAIRNNVFNTIQEENHRIQSLESGLSQRTGERMHTVEMKFKKLCYDLQFRPLQKVFDKQKEMQMILSDLAHGFKRNFNQKKEQLIFIRRNIPGACNKYWIRLSQRIENMENTTWLLDPQNILKRGFSITTGNGKIIKDSKQVNPGEMIETRVFIGNIHSKVENKK